MIALVPHCGFLSETSRMIAIAQALAARGEPVALATHGGPFTRLLEEAGLPFTWLAPAMDDARTAAFVDGVANLGQPGRRLQSAVEVRASVESEAAFLRGCEADVVVTGFTVSLYLSSRVVGVPLVTSHGGSFVPPVFERRAMPVPTQGPSAGFDWLPGALLRMLSNAAPPRMKEPARFLNEVAGELGVEPVPSLAALMLGDLTLVTDVPEVLGIPAEVMEGWRPRPGALYRPTTRLRYTGPMFARLELPVPERVAAFLDRRRPTACVALTSSTPAFIREVVAGVRAAGLRVIIAATVHELRELEADDVVVAGVLPAHRVLPQVDLAVIMGGQGSVQCAMSSATPFLGFPLHAEQELNVGIGIRHGMALGLAPRRTTAARVTQAARRIVGESSFASAARRVSALYANVDGPARAADAILAYRAERAA